MLPFPYLVFRTVLEQGTFYKASVVLNVTPSAISHSVNQLESELGFPVFVRSRTGVKLTPDGQKILPLIQEIINDQNRLEQVAQQIQGLDTGLIRIGAFSSACINWLPPLIQTFAKSYPQVKISVRQAGFNEITEAVKSGQLDLGLTMMPENDLGITVEKILEDEIYCIAPMNFQVKNGHSVSEEDLVNYNFILQQSDYDLDTKAALDHYSIKSTAIQFSIDDQSIVAMVEAGLGLGILPALALQKMQGEVQILPFSTPFYRKIALVTSSQQRLAPSTRQMIKNVHELIRQQYPTGRLTMVNDDK
ncbi:LysR family transcriptional regulator [Lactobacillus equicursoris]|uniref:LysR family transcriptional regulator n=1 Tax=Lactobacillus equicursoris TaxID=420645 RepID=A0A844FPG3_9LACO|nr:LysR family transcriptional regulator [Lactobacillus equicursoris]MDD6387012.1 LysR family transcriptional regulator [Lactobacillus equicursoris]MST80199.1 LysR family transcriptional regulator [Lactobacillus equicursoris]